MHSVHCLMQRQRHTGSCSTRLAPAATWRHCCLVTSIATTTLRRTLCLESRGLAAALGNPLPPPLLLLLQSMLGGTAGKSQGSKSQIYQLPVLRQNLLRTHIAKKGLFHFSTSHAAWAYSFLSTKFFWSILTYSTQATQYIIWHSMHHGLSPQITWILCRSNCMYWILIHMQWWCTQIILLIYLSIMAYVEYSKATGSLTSTTPVGLRSSHDNIGMNIFVICPVSTPCFIRKDPVLNCP